MVIIDKIYGEQNIDDPLISELLQSSELERLKGVGQYGTWILVNKNLSTTRFEHSLGVYLLLKRFGASKEEQVAGLLHDVNHTAFSHVIDYVFGDPSVQEFGDDTHRDIILNSSLPAILRKHGIDVHKVSDAHGFNLLDRNLPDLCCDRLDYCLRDSACCGFIDSKGVAEILDDIIINDGDFVFKNKESAHRLATLFLKTSKFLWGNEFQSGSFSLFADALKLAIKQGIINLDDFYATDDALLNKLLDSGDPAILHIIDSIRNEALVSGTKEDHDIFVKTKARFIDPKFLEGTSTMRLSEVDPAFANEVEDYKRWVSAGFYIKIKR